MASSQNGWPALPADSKNLVTWVIPAKSGEVRLRLRNGSGGFVVAFFVLWFAEKVQPLKGRVLDDWGYAWRPIRGQDTGLSNHASGTAADLNALQHVLGRENTFTKKQETLIHKRLRWMRGVLRWGGDYRGRKDEMHFEVVQSLSYCERVARKWMARTPRGRRLIKANPSQKAVINS